MGYSTKPLVRACILLLLALMAGAIVALSCFLYYEYELSSFLEAEIADIYDPILTSNIRFTLDTEQMIHDELVSEGVPSGSECFLIFTTIQCTNGGNSYYLCERLVGEWACESDSTVSVY